MSEWEQATQEIASMLARARAEDPQMAMVEAGTLAMHCGVECEQFQVALRVTPGEEPGVSLRAFLVALGGRSPEAKQTMRNLGLRFITADERIRPMAEIGAELDRGLRARGFGTSVRAAVVETIFGDGAPTALGLMELAKGEGA